MKNKEKIQPCKKNPKIFNNHNTKIDMNTLNAKEINKKGNELPRMNHPTKLMVTRKSTTNKKRGNPRASTTVIKKVNNTVYVRVYSTNRKKLKLII